MKCVFCGNQDAVQLEIFCRPCIAKHAYTLPPHTKIETDDATVTLYGDRPAADVIVAGGEGRDSGDIVGTNAIFTLCVVAAVLTAVAFGVYLCIQHTH